MFLNDLAPLITSKLRGRSDLVTRYPMWANSVSKELSQNFEFEELKVTGPTKNFEINKATYPINYFGIPNDPVNFNIIVTLFRYFSTDNPPTPGQTGSTLKPRAMAVVEPKINIPGMPVQFAQHGTQLIFGFNPDQAYAVYMRYQRKHPNVNLMQDQLFFPDDWDDILAYAIAIKGCEEVGMNEISVEYFKKLHGDPEEPKNLGLIKARISQQRRVMNQSDRRLNVVVSRY